jgi:adenosylcobinamide kinase / adenosylcobinamide-phosphate guanylyltransferase
LQNFVIGGARSGKSSFALQKASGIRGRKAYIATAQALDAEMKDRIDRHKQERAEDWHTIEEPTALPALLKSIGNDYEVILLDCLTVWLSNLMMQNADIEAEVESLLSAMASCRAELFIVANEVGMGIVPDNELSRRFRDWAGIINRKIASASDNVYLVTAGISLRIKGAE